MRKASASAANGSTESRAGFRPASLDAVDFLLADVRGALGSYLNVFLVTHQHWSQTEVGWVTTVGGLFGLAAQTPIGAAIDATRAKRGAVVLALAVLAVDAATLHGRTNKMIAGRQNGHDDHGKSWLGRPTPPSGGS